MNIKFEKSNNLKTKPDENNLGFGKYFTDYMLTMDYSNEAGWHNAKIVPYGPLSLSPASFVLHYAQEVFEGMKAYRTPDNKIQLFRPEMNARRLQSSCERLCIPKISEDVFLETINSLVKVEQDWVPHLEGTSLYIRPFIFSTEQTVGLHASGNFKFVVILCPVGNYYPEGVNPVKIYVEDQLVRASKGGTGFTKCGGNYAASMLAQVQAQEKGYTQVLWLDGEKRKYVEEVGSMNALFKIDGKIYTSPIDGTVLPGVTRDSCIKLLKEWGYEVAEEHFSIDFLMEAGRTGKLEEAFGTGTAAVISPIGELFYKGETVIINNFKTGKVTQKLYDTLTDIQWGKTKDPFNWIQEL